MKDGRVDDCSSGSGMLIVEGKQECRRKKEMMNIWVSPIYIASKVSNRPFSSVHYTNTDPYTPFPSPASLSRASHVAVPRIPGP